MWKLRAIPPRDTGEYICTLPSGEVKLVIYRNNLTVRGWDRPVIAWQEKPPAYVEDRDVLDAVLSGRELLDLDDDEDELMY